MNADEKILISKCISELDLQIEYFKKNKNLFISPGKTWSDRADEMLNVLKKDNHILKNFKRSNLFNSDIPAENIKLFKKIIFKIFSLLPRVIGYHPYVNLLEDH